ncbi:MAG TPA: serine protease [Candidatus Paceibacterota bacterium]
MKKTLYIAVLSALIYPAFAQAAWQDPFIWIISGRFNAPATAAIKTTIEEAEATSTAPAYVAPSTEDLLKRIAELEDKLDKALAKNAELVQAKQVASAAAPAAKAESNGSGITSSDLIAKVRPAIVAIDTATSSGSGVIIDSQGRILVSARTVLNYDSSGAAIGAAENMSVTFSNGTSKQAKLVGFNESHNVAIVQLASGSASSYLKNADVSALKAGDKAYVFASAQSKTNSGGTDIVSGTVSSKVGGSVEMTSDKKPLDNAGALVNGKGELVALPRTTSCKIMEESHTCLTYKIGADIVSSFLAKPLEGMRLYKNKKVRTDEEFLVRGQLEGTLRAISSSGTLEYGIASLSGKNSFDNFNNKLVDDEEGKITRLYLAKLKIGADSLMKANDVLKAQAHALNIFFIDYAAQILTLGDYQRKILKAMEVENALKFKEYEAKVNYWSAKRNEYDSLITKPQNATHDFLMEEGAAMESGVKYLEKERKRVLDSVSSEIIGLF